MTRHAMGRRALSYRPNALFCVLFCVETVSEGTANIVFQDPCLKPLGHPYDLGISIAYPSELLNATRTWTQFGPKQQSVDFPGASPYSSREDWASGLIVWPEGAQHARRPRIQPRGAGRLGAAC